MATLEDSSEIYVCMAPQLQPSVKDKRMELAKPQEVYANIKPSDAHEKLNEEVHLEPIRFEDRLKSEESLESSHKLPTAQTSVSKNHVCANINPSDAHEKLNEEVHLEPIRFEDRLKSEGSLESSHKLPTAQTSVSKNHVYASIKPSAANAKLNEEVHLEPIRFEDRLKSEGSLESSHKLPTSQTSVSKNRKGKRKLMKKLSFGLCCILSITAMGICVWITVKDSDDQKWKIIELPKNESIVIEQLKERVERLTMENRKLLNVSRLTENLEASISQLNQSLDDLTKKNEVFKKTVEENNKYNAALRTGYAQLKDGWIGLFNGYQYKLTSADLNYTSGREECVSMGATVAKYGVQSMENRRTLSRSMNFPLRTWIGLKKRIGGVTWKWEDGAYASNPTALWYPGEPIGGDDVECAEIWYFDLLTYERICSTTKTHRSLCEREWEDWGSFMS